ncbi:MAG: peptidylprolyl isomerase [Candidatus Woesearchaeota archaeon]|nr:peptidylprolyl isomerase [Candidatus Woesearchaeota archaeon]
MRQWILLTLVLLASCMGSSIQSTVETTEAVEVFLSLAPDATYKEVHFSGDDAAAVQELVQGQCPTLPDSFSRATYDAGGMKLVLYVDEEVVCTILQPGEQKETVFKKVSEAPEGVALTVNGVEVPVTAIQAVLPEGQDALNLAVNRVVNDELLRQAAADIVVSEEDVTQTTATFFEQAGVTGEEGRAQLKESSISDEEFAQQMEGRAKLEKLLNEKLGADALEVSEEDARAYYLQNTNQFVQQEQAVMRHILVSAESRSAAAVTSRAELVREKLADTDFCELVTEYSDDIQNKEQCGTYVIPRGAVLPAIEEAAFTTPANEVAIVETEQGVHFVQSLEVTPTQVAEFAQIAENLKETLKNTALQQRLNLYLQLLRADAEIVAYLAADEA